MNETILLYSWYTTFFGSAETLCSHMCLSCSHLVRNPGTISVLVLLLMPRKRKGKSFNEGILEQATQIDGYV